MKEQNEEDEDAAEAEDNEDVAKDEDYEDEDEDEDNKYNQKVGNIADNYKIVCIWTVGWR